MLQRKPCGASRCWSSLEAYGLPRSEWMINPAFGRRRPTARVRACITRSRGMRSDIDPPTPAREYQSKTTAKYRPPAPVHRDVISDTHFGLGAWAVKSGFSQFGATGRLCFDGVVALYFFAARAFRPSARIRFATRGRPTRPPSAFSSAVNRGEP